MHPIVCVHGAGGGGWEYELWRPVFEQAGYPLIAFDLQPAAAGLAATTTDDYLRQIIAWIPQSEPFFLIGASMGGLLALKVAEQITPAALVLVNSVPPSDVAAKRVHKTYPPIIHWEDGAIEETRSALFDSDEATIEWVWQRWRNESGAVLQQLTGAFPVQRPNCPTLAVLSEQDHDIPYQDGLALAQWAHADVLLYHGMSHVGPLLSRRAQEVARTIITWCQAQG